MTSSSRFRSLLLLPLFACTACSARVPLPPASIAPDPASLASRQADDPSVVAYAARLAARTPTPRTPFDASDGISLHEAEAIALVLNPALRAKRLAAGVPAAGAREAGRPVDPRLELDVVRILESVSSPWVLASGLAFTVPLQGRLEAERALACAEAAVARHEARVAEWQTLCDLRAAWTRLAATLERARLIAAHIEAVRAVHAVATTRHGAQQLGRPDVRLLALEATSREGAHQRLAKDAHAARLEILALLGLAPEADVPLLPDLVAAPDDGAPATPGLARHPRLLLAAARFRAADRHLRHEAAQRLGDLEIGPLLESDEGIARLGAGIGVPLPLWNQNRRAIAEACAARTAARASYHATHESLVHALAAARADEARHAASAAWIAERVAPLADEQLRDVREIGRLGDLDVLLLADALTRVLDARLDVLDARREEALAAHRRQDVLAPLVTPRPMEEVR